MENTKEAISILNDLIEINNDRVKGFEKALNDVEGDAELRATFTEKIGESHHLKMQLAKEVEVLGGEAETGTSVSGTIHRTWLDMKAKFTGHDEHSILEDCEFGEDAILKAYKSAIADEHLPAYLRDILNDQVTVLQASHDEIKALRDSTVQ
ncbi:PA2169 family four-helix-bundle protein [Mucilaginibacter auburnensis]|uniref:Uncharacterized protein (TIGR02284 family) n=1 Tax=Mucilaginibacter auburnensis TaxID=1457233 RepID=A0A2H9VTW1_9SPHI|nr:PA2169 family four-helix-bundle protein [Mucilaginibacter auburnensis]PJJ84241.1 uncharacterized protein (TIGR02284 family) [Mucilaginibacter auburnensis]